MTSYDFDKIKSIKDFPTLIDYLKEELEWPIDIEDVEDLTFDYDPEELGLDEKSIVKIKSIKQLRPLITNQSWGIFYIEFESKRLPVVVLRRILRDLVPKKRSSASLSERAVWNLNDLLFISALGEEEHRGISFAHFSDSGDKLPVLKTFSWDEREEHFYYLKNLNLESLRWPENENDIESWKYQWARAFTTEHRAVIRTSKELSIELAKLARRTRALVNEIYKYESITGTLHQLHESFKKVLISDLRTDGFADMVAQTIAYGLFSAKASGEQVLNISHLEEMIPNTNPFLKELFTEFTKMSGHKKGQIDFDEIGISDIVEMLNSVNIESILQDFGRQTGGGTEDPVIHFYESFLKEYDAQQKIKRGVFYTPKPIVNYIVRSVDQIIRSEFDCPDGLADISTIKVDGKTWPKILILDPAVGTGTFLETVIDVIYETMYSKWKKEGKDEKEINKLWNEYVPKHLLPRLYGFELMMAPYSVAHMKLGLKLKQTGYDFSKGERLRVFLTNTLEPASNMEWQLELIPKFLSQEAEQSNKVKEKTPITVIVGNPPYSFKSVKSKYINELMKIYKEDVRTEKKYGVLEDDYIKFIRFAHWQIEQSGNGILGFITNNSYLSGIIHRGMRKELMETFDNIFLLNLHGSSRIGEKSPKGSKDENVFDIQQGVNIGLYVKLEKLQKHKNICYYDLYGLRDEYKHPYLINNDISTTKWQEIKPVAPYYFFVPKDFELQENYEKFSDIREIFIENISGVQTKRDKLAISYDKNELKNRMLMFTNLNISDEIIKQTFKLPNSSDINIRNARELVKKENILELTKIYHYRPFDYRIIYYSDAIISRSRKNIMKHLFQENLGLILRRTVEEKYWFHIFVTNKIIDINFLKAQSYIFPLYLYHDKNVGAIHELPLQNSVSEKDRIPNFNNEFLETINESLEKQPTPEEIFYYIYAVLYSPTYRKRYEEFLKIDFPRVPFTSNYDVFKNLSDLGKELVDLHLLNTSIIDETETYFPITGFNVVEKVSYDENNQRIFINKEQYFENIPKEIWEYQIGGYQVCNKWLKDRKCRTLSQDDIQHYCKIVTAIQKTIEIQAEIDVIYPEVEKDIIEFENT